MSTYNNRVDQFVTVLEADVVDIAKLRNLCFNGIPDKTSVRSLAWRFLLDYLPANRSNWSSHLKGQRQLYDGFLDDIIINPSFADIDDDDTEGHQLQHVVDHPLNPDPESQWATYFKDNVVLAQIDKDARRLYPDMSFFQKATEFPCKKIGSHSLRKRVEKTILQESKVTTNRQGVQNIITKKNKKDVEQYQILSEGEEAHWEVAERMLFIYAKLNPGIGYVQGMNEILGPIYYTFAADTDIEWRKHAEADAFFCFTNLMAENRDNFIRTLDNSVCGIGYWMRRVCQSLRYRDNELWHTLEDKNILPEYYCFRWFTLLLSQEFPLPDVTRIWDSLFAVQARFEFLVYICVAMLILVRIDILEGDFSTIIKTLQNYPVGDVQIILTKATELRDG